MVYSRRTTRIWRKKNIFKCTSPQQKQACVASSRYLRCWRVSWIHYLSIFEVSLMFCWPCMYLLRRPAPGPSPCPLHTQQNSGRIGRKPILWPPQSRSSSMRLWCESYVYFYFTLWVFIADAANPKRLAPLLLLVLSRSERWNVIARLSAPTDPRFDCDGAQDDPTVVIAFVQRRGGRLDVGLRGRGRERETKV